MALPPTKHRSFECWMDWCCRGHWLANSSQYNSHIWTHGCCCYKLPWLLFLWSAAASYKAHRSKSYGQNEIAHTFCAYGRWRLEACRLPCISIRHRLVALPWGTSNQRCTYRAFWRQWSHLANHSDQYSKRWQWALACSWCGTFYVYRTDTSDKPSESYHSKRKHFRFLPCKCAMVN